MRGVLAVLLGAALLAGCGQSGAPGAARAGADVCAMAPDARAVFGAVMETEADAGGGTIAGGCRWRSADGAVMGEAALFTPQSIGGDPDAATPPAIYAKLSTALEGLSDAPVEPVAGLGDEANRTLQAFGDQTQIVVRKGDQVLLVRASTSGDSEKTSAIAERLAHTLLDAMDVKPAK